MIAVPGEKGREELDSPVWLQPGVSLLTIHGRELRSQFFLGWLSVIDAAALREGSAQSRLHSCSALDLAQAAGKPEETLFLLTGQIWELPGNMSSFQFDTHLCFGNLWQPCSRV